MQPLIHILAFGPHPDDVDMGCGGTLYKTALQGKYNVIIDLTPSQLSTRGTPETRQQEAQEAARILQAYHRENLGLEDLQLQDDDMHRQIIAYQIRKWKPEIIMFPNSVDRHPDHESTAKLIKSSIFVAGLAKYDIQGLAPYRPRMSLEYMIWDNFEPDLIIGLSDHEFDHKLQAFYAFQSQITTNQRADHYIKGKSMQLGRSIGKAHGEGFRVHQSKVGIENFDHIYTRTF